jgi:hypothetical protein
MFAAGQPDGKGASVVEFTLDGDRAFVGIDYEFGDAQAQAAAACSAGKAAVNLVELREYLFD